MTTEADRGRRLMVFGPHFGLPDPSPFCMKAMVLLKLSGLAFETRHGDVRKAPKAKFPVLFDDGNVIPDSTFIRIHLEDRYEINFDRDLSDEQRGAAWAFEKLAEDHLYWIVVAERWSVPENFEAGPRQFFDPVPAVMRPAVRAYVRRDVMRSLHLQGTSRHSRDEYMVLADRGFRAISEALGSKPWLFGAEPCAADASVFATIASGLPETFDTPLIETIHRYPNLIDYHQRGMATWFDDFKPAG